MTPSEAPPQSGKHVRPAVGRASLRTSLLLWYTLVLLVVIGTFAGTVGSLLWWSMLGDIDGDLRTTAAAFVRGLRPAGPDGYDLDLPPEYRVSDGDAPPPPIDYAVWTPTGALIDSSRSDLAAEAPRMVGVRTRDGRRELVATGPGGALVLAARDLGEAETAVRTFLGIALVGGGLALLVSLAGGWILIGRGLAPVTRINRAAAAMAGGDLTARIAVEGTESELEHVAHALNGAFDRLSRALETTRRFTADASHELRTPLATITAETEWALDRSRTADEYRASLTTCRRAVERMATLVDRLVRMARADDEALHLEKADVDLETVVHDALALVSPLAVRHGIAIASACAPVHVDGDRQRLTELVANLCTNAVQYNRDGGRVAVELWQEGVDAQLRVTDTGVGISESDLPRVFDRLFRADDARSRRSGGEGLGLAIARWIVQAHGGRITCTSQLGIGTEIRVSLPLRPAA